MQYISNIHITTLQKKLCRLKFFSLSLLLGGGTSLRILDNYANVPEEPLYPRVINFYQILVTFEYISPYVFQTSQIDNRDYHIGV